MISKPSKLSCRAIKHIRFLYISRARVIPDYWSQMRLTIARTMLNFLHLLAILALVDMQNIVKM